MQLPKLETVAFIDQLSFHKPYLINPTGVSMRDVYLRCTSVLETKF